ncbi:MAG: hypothetical protein HQL93_00415 [Magnetococcales bacterium]|nr:hypothetical protein [Magnetococcales bacterium]
MNPPNQPDLQAQREQLARLLFETETPDIPTLLAHNIKVGNRSRPTAEQLLKPLQASLKSFKITL